MSQSPLDKFLKRTAPGPTPTAPSGTPGTSLPGELYEETRFYARRRGQGQEVMLDIRQTNGNRIALPYALLVGIAFDASGEMRLFYTERSIVIQGRGLLPIYEGLLDHTIRFIQEDSARYESLATGETFISGVYFDDSGERM
jgi:hypothetical protein